MILFAFAAEAACPDPAESLEKASVALIAGSDATPALAEAESRLGCTKVDATLLSRLWLVTGAAHLISGDSAGAEPFLAAAAVHAPGFFDERLGPDVRKAWESAKLEGPGRLVVDRPVLIDGRRTARFPAVVDSGPHAVQSAGRDWAKVVLVAPNEEISVTSPVPTEAPKQAPVFLIVSGVSVAGAGSLGVLAAMQSEALAGAHTVAALDEARDTQSAMAWSAIGFAAIAASSATLHFVF